MDFGKWSNRRVIDRLRAKYPTGPWRYDHSRNAWISPTNREVYAYARLAPQYDGDDDSFVTEYRWADTGELALGGWE